MEPLLQVGEEHVRKQNSNSSNTTESDAEQSVVKKKAKRRIETDGNVPVL